MFNSLEDRRWLSWYLYIKAAIEDLSTITLKFSQWYYCWCCSHEDSVRAKTSANRLANVQRKELPSTNMNQKPSWTASSPAGNISRKSAGEQALTHLWIIVLFIERTPVCSLSFYLGFYRSPPCVQCRVASTVIVGLCAVKPSDGNLSLKNPARWQSEWHRQREVNREPIYLWMVSFFYSQIH